MKATRIVLLLLVLLLVNCSTNRLREYNFRDKTVSGYTFAPPRPGVFTDLNLYFNADDPIGTLLNLGSTVIREKEAIKARAKMDSAAQQVNVPILIENELVMQSAEILDARPVRDKKDADFVFNIRIERYGIDAESWDAGTYFTLEADIDLVDKEKRKVWEKHIDRQFPLQSHFFGLGRSVESVLDAAALSELTVEEIAAGLENLGVEVASIINEKLYNDYVKSREPE